MKNLIAALLLASVAFKASAEEPTLNLRLTPPVDYNFGKKEARRPSILVPIGFLAPTTLIALNYLNSDLSEDAAGGIVIASGALIFVGSVINIARSTGENRNGRYRCKALPLGCAFVGVGTILMGVGFRDPNGLLIYAGLASACYVPGITLIAVGALVNLIRNTSFNDHYSLQLITPKPNEIGIALNF